MLNYHKETKNHYKNSGVAESYYRAYNEKINRKNFRSQLVAKREVGIIDSFLGQIEANEVLDIPTGTGKLLHLFKKHNLTAECSDISRDMLDLARKEAEKIGYNKVNFSVGDAEKINTSFPEKTFDLIICLRLLHRVPNQVKENVLAQLAKKSKYAIVSFGLDSPYYNLRRRIKNKIFEKSTGKLGAEKKKEILKMLERNNLEIIDQKLVLPILCQEIVFLVKTKKN